MNKLPEDISCATCIWGGATDEDGLVECRRYPPEIYVLADGAVMQLRPRVSPSDGCGEHGEYREDSDE